MNNKKGRIYKKFTIEKLFCVKKVTGNPVENYNTGKYPYVSTSSVNNGVNNFVEGDPKSISKGGVISIDPIKGSSFYHPYDFVGRGFSGASVNLLHNSDINKASGLFICKQIEKTASEKSSYGYLFNSERLNKGAFLLPITPEGSPDYEYMEKYIKEIEKKKVDEYLEYAKRELEKLGEVEEILKLEDKEWAVFKVKDIFFTETKGEKLQVPTGANVKKDNLIDGATPRITVTSNNNGVYGYYTSNDKNYRKFTNIVTVSFLGDAFYHPYECSLDMKVHCLKLLNKEWNRELALFIINEVINNTRHNNFGNQLSSTDLPNKTILLPITPEGSPDYEYMEKYMKNIMIRKYREYVEYKENDDD